MSIIIGRGEDAKKAIEDNSTSIDLKKIFIKLKANESIRVRVLTKFDYVAYKAHGHFQNGIYTQPCIKASEGRCLLCEAANYEGELVDEVYNSFTKKNESEWKSMFARKRVMFAFADLEDGEIRVFDATRNQADGLIATIDEYGDDLEDIAFTFKRTGDGRDTTYTLSPIMPNRMKDVQEAFDKFDGEEVETDLFIEALQARTIEQQAKELQKAGFPVKDVLNIEVKADEDTNDNGEPIDEINEIDEEDLPF